MIYSREALIQEIRVAHSILEDYHHKCHYDKIDETKEETEYCRSDDTAYGTGFEQLTCYEHDRLRAWSKMLKDEYIANHAPGFSRGLQR